MVQMSWVIESQIDEDLAERIAKNTESFDRVEGPRTAGDRRVASRAFGG